MRILRLPVSYIIFEEIDRKDYHRMAAVNPALSEIFETCKPWLEKDD
jgi:hypothetical protein